MSIIIDGSKNGTALSDTATQTLSNKTLVSPVITGTPVFESGSWTPSIGGTATYTGTPFGSYHKIGRQVFATLDLRINVKGTGSATTISGLPYVAASGGYTSFASVSYWDTGAVSPTFVSGYITPATNNIILTGTTAASANITDPISLLGNGTRIILSVTYLTA